jgi:hypothetical protein
MIISVLPVPAMAGEHPYPFSKVKLEAPIAFRKHVLSETFYSEGASVGDVNHDGKIDVLAGPHWYEAPGWKPHEIRTPGTFDYATGYCLSFLDHAMDVNQDGWVDMVIIGFPGREALWYENPQNKEGHWAEHKLAQWACNETPQFLDMDGNSRHDVVMGFTPETEPLGWMAWFASPDKPGETRWPMFVISEPAAPGTFRFSHGLGVGDINGDGRRDVIITKGWWEGPDNPRTHHWKFHEANLGDDCADMYAWDVDDDGDTDVISSSAHNYGIWWHEQKKDAKGAITWERHTIYDKFSQTHALEMADINGDGLPDLVTGKRFFAHNGRDSGAHEPAVLYWFEFGRKEGRPYWEPHAIDDNSGIGTQFTVADITGDGKLDIITSNKKGTYVHENVTH